MSLLSVPRQRSSSSHVRVVDGVVWENLWKETIITNIAHAQTIN